MIEYALLVVLFINVGVLFDYWWLKTFWKEIKKLEQCCSELA